jgi:hypothetical protein
LDSGSTMGMDILTLFGDPECRVGCPPERILPSRPPSIV